MEHILFMESDTHEFTRYGKACVKDAITQINQIMNVMVEEAYLFAMNGIRTSIHFMFGQCLMGIEMILP